MAGYYIGELSADNLKKVFGYDKVGEFKIANLAHKDSLKALGFEFAIVYCYDRIITDYVDNLDIDISNIMEIRAFNESSEIKIWRGEDTLMGSIFKETNSGTRPIVEKYILYPRKTGGADPGHLIVKKYIDYDVDGQAYISYVKPSSFEEVRV